MVRAKDTVANGTAICLLAVEIYSTAATFRSSMDIRHAQGRSSDVRLSMIAFRRDFALLELLLLLLLLLLLSDRGVVFLLVFHGDRGVE
jgi:hypothetical protein